MAYDLYMKYKYSLQQELVCADTYSRSSRYVILEDRTKGLREGNNWIELHAPVQREDYILLGREGVFSLLWRP